jgi:hypothetical protein
MFKFLRKYNKWILAIGGGLLMISFLLMDTLPRLAGDAGIGRATRATIDGPDGTRRVPARIWSQILQEFEFIRIFERQGPAIPELGRFHSAGHWYLLGLEAERAGLVGAATPQALGMSEQQIRNIQLNFAVSRDAVLSGMAKLEGISRMVAMYQGAGELSDKRMRDFAARVFHNVTMQMVVFEADADAVDFTPSDDQIQEHFTKYREYAPGDGPMGFGYLLPNRFKIEWIRIPGEEIRRSIVESGEMTGVRLRMHWRSNPPGNFPPVEDGAAVPEVVREHLLNELTNERLDDLTRYITQQLRTSRAGVPERDGYLRLPEDWEQRKISLRQLAESIREELNITLPEYTAIGDRWLTIEDVPDLGGIATASTDRFGARPVRLAELIQAMREFDGSLTITTQARVAGPPLRTDTQDLYVYRVTEADPSRPAHSVDEVYDDVVNDLRREAHFRVLVDTATGIEQEAARLGILGLSLRHDVDLHQPNVTLADVMELFQLMQRGEPMRLVPSNLPVIGRHRPTVDALIDFARSLPQDVPARSLPVPQRITSVPVEDHLALVVAMVEEQEPVSTEDFRDLTRTGMIRAIYISEEIGGSEQLLATFGFDALREKYNFQLQLLDEDDITPEELEELGITLE